MNFMKYFIFLLFFVLSSCSSINNLNLKVVEIGAIDSTHCYYKIKGNHVNTLLKDTCGLFSCGDSLKLKPTEFNRGTIYNLSGIYPCNEFSVYEVKKGNSLIVFTQVDSIKYDFDGINKFRLIKK
jgi:hypothetical protein